MSSIPGSVGYKSMFKLFIEPTITWIPSGFSGYIWLDTKIVLTKLYYINQVIANLYSAHMDPDVWPNPEKFIPERFLDDDGKFQEGNRVIPFSIGMI